jgi:hypothetical protein
MGKFMLNLTLGETLALVKKSPCFDDPLELDVLLVSVLHIGVHDPIHCHMLNAFKIELCRGQVLGHVQSVQESGKYGQSNSTLNMGCKPRKGEILNSKGFSPTTLMML